MSVSTSTLPYLTGFGYVLHLWSLQLKKCFDPTERASIRIRIETDLFTSQQVLKGDRRSLMTIKLFNLIWINRASALKS